MVFGGGESLGRVLDVNGIIGVLVSLLLLLRLLDRRLSWMDIRNGRLVCRIGRGGRGGRWRRRACMRLCSRRWELVMGVDLVRREGILIYGKIRLEWDLSKLI